MTLVMTSGPAVEPVTLAEARTHLRVDGVAEDALIASLIITSRLHIEAALGIALIDQTWSYSLDRWPRSRTVVLPLKPVRSVAQVRVWAAVLPVSGDERLSADALTGRLTHEVWIRYRPGVTRAMRFQHAGRTLDINAVLEDRGLRHRLRCLCVEHDL